MQNRNRNAPLRKHGNERGKQLHLAVRGTFVLLIRPCEMSEEALDADSRKTADPRCLIRRRCSHHIADPAHAGIQGDVDGRPFPRLYCQFRQSLRAFIAEDGRAEIVLDQLAEAALRAHSENQDGLRNTVFPQYDSLLRGGRRVSANVRVDGTRHRY